MINRQFEAHVQHSIGLNNYSKLQEHGKWARAMKSFDKDIKHEFLP